MNANKKQRTEERGPAAAVAATPLVESVAPVFGFNPTNETWGDGMKWDEMDHDTRLRFLTPRFSETGRPDKPEPHSLINIQVRFRLITCGNIPYQDNNTGNLV